MSAWRILSIGILLLVTSTAAWSQQTSNLPSTSRGTFLKLTEVQKLWEDEDYAQAVVELETLTAEVRDDPYEYALSNQYLAHTRLLAGDNAGARVAIEAALSNDDIPAPMKASLGLSYGQLLIGDEEFDLALTYLEQWLELTDAPPMPGQLFYVAYANFMTGNLPRARTLIERAITEGQKPDDQWERIYYQILSEQGEHEQALDVLMGMLNRTPTND